MKPTFALVSSSSSSDPRSLGAARHAGGMNKFVKQHLRLYGAWANNVKIGKRKTQIQREGLETRQLRRKFPHVRQTAASIDFQQLHRRLEGKYKTLHRENTNFMNEYLGMFRQGYGAKMLESYGSLAGRYKATLPQLLDPRFNLCLGRSEGAAETVINALQ